MGGSGGGIIINHARTALSDPTIHGQLPTAMCIMVDAVLDKDEWDDKDKEIIAKAFRWALFNCQ
jgi:hypothetical protein